ncbi:MAG: F420-dependent methylenetetrahydromethanopterin dehydrogenase [Candidatus Heimdallarchaeota archaeon]
MSKKEESPKISKVGILKLGNIATSVLLEMLLDERADRLDIDVRTISSGAKLEEKSISDALTIFLKEDFDLSIITTPNASLKNPQKAIKKIKEKSPNVIVISDILKKDHREEFKEKGIGYLIVKSDAMIGARREFLDPTEMAIFNADLIKVLSIGGAFNVVYQKIDEVLSLIKENKKIVLPHKVITPIVAVEFAGFSNPYAEAKARGALEIAQKVAAINTEGCFKINDRQEYIAQVAAAHEMMRHAAKLADEAREIEKASNKVRRQPHSYSGDVQDKRTLKEKPTSHYK